MDILEALRIAGATRYEANPNHYEGASRFLKPYRILEEDKERYRAARDLLEDVRAYIHLTQDERRQVAQDALSLSTHKICLDDYLPQEILANIARTGSSALQGLYNEIIEKGLFGGNGETFQSADAVTRDHLLTLVEEPEETYAHRNYHRFHVLEALAWIRDEVVLQKWREWRSQTPDWYKRAYQGSWPIERFSWCAGWELTSEGQALNLYFQDCYALLPIAEGEEPAGPVEVCVRQEARCKWCTGKLDLLFDCNLTDERLAFLKPYDQHERLCVLICSECTLLDGIVVNDSTTGKWSTLSRETNAHVFEKINDPDIKAEETNEETEITFEKDSEILNPACKFTLGPKRGSQEALGMPWDEGTSQIGGMPVWVQDLEYVRCPACQRTMVFIGQVNLEELYEMDGMLYAFVCQNCGLATTTSQCT